MNVDPNGEAERRSFRRVSEPPAIASLVVAQAAGEDGGGVLSSRALRDPAQACGSDDCGSTADYRRKQSYAETVSRWQSLAYGPNYNAAYCIAVCPAGEDVIGPYLAGKARHLKDVVDPLRAKAEPVYAVKGSDAADHVAKHYPHKRLRLVRSSARVSTVKSFLWGMKLSFQPGKAADLAATYHLAFTGREAAEATITIRDRTLTVVDGIFGEADLRLTVDGAQWIRFLNKEVSLVRLLLTRKLRLKGPPRLLAAFGRCFPS